MSTQVRFDAAGLKRAIETCNVGYRVALHAPHAELRVVDEDRPGSAPEVFHGRTAIAHWVESLRALGPSSRVVDLTAAPTLISLLEEYDRADGRRWAYWSTVELDGAQIIRESIVRRTVEHGVGASEPMFDADAPRPRREPGHGSRPASAGAATSSRSLPGQYLG